MEDHPNINAYEKGVDKAYATEKKIRICEIIRILEGVCIENTLHIVYL